jgi:hypothetical protein
MEPQTLEQQAAAGVMLVVTKLEQERFRVRYPLQQEGFDTACKALACAILFASESFDRHHDDVLERVLRWVNELEYCGRGN